MLASLMFAYLLAPLITASVVLRMSLKGELPMPERRDRERAHTGENQRRGVWRRARMVLALMILAVMVAWSLPVKVLAVAGSLASITSIGESVPSSATVRRG